jgi:hypothetical protein
VAPEWQAAVSSILQAKALPHFVQGIGLFLAAPNALDHLFGQIYVFKIVQSLTNVGGRCPVRSGSKSLQPFVGFI